MRNLLELLLPGACVLCGDRAADALNLCPGCLRDLPAVHGACRRCALPLPAPGVCARCEASPPPFRRAVVSFRYEEPVDTLIQQLKYHQELSIAPTLGRLLALRIAEVGAPLPECILPVPLHPRRLRARGFNQSLEISRALAAGTGIPVKYRWARRVRDTPAQSRIENLRARQINVRGAFSASSRLSRYGCVAIVDDVVTTGATATELARAVLAQGVLAVDLWCIARAERGPAGRPGP